MKLNPAALDDEIRAVEQVIASDRKLLEEAVVGYVEGARTSAINTITSPKFLLAAVGIGFVIGKFLLRGEKNRAQQKEEGAPVKKSVLGMLAAGAFSIANAQFGGPAGMARWAAGRLYEYRRSRAATAEFDTPTSGLGGRDPAMQPSAPLHKTHL